MSTKTLNSTTDAPASDMAAGRVGKTTAPGPAHKALAGLIGRWVTAGHTIASAEQPSVEILASDVYEWAPGGFFVLHTAYGRIGDANVGALEIIGYDAAGKRYFSRFFDNQGITEEQDMTVRGDTWAWSGQKTRCTSVMSPDGKTMVARHERLDGSSWVHSMDVTLSKIE